MIYVIYGGVAILVGFLFSILFVRMDEQWKTITLSVANLPFVFGVLVSLNAYIGEKNVGEDLVSLTACYIISLVASIIIVFVLTCFLVKKQAEIVKVRILDIVLAYPKFLESYYESRKSEIDKELNYESLKLKATNLDAREKLIEEKERIIDEQVKSGVYLELPVNKRQPIDNVFLSVLPTYIENYLKFYYELKTLTMDFINNYTENVTDNIEFIMGYFVAICVNINTVLFDTNGNNVRSHVRIKKGGHYVSYLNVIGRNSIEHNVMKIPVGEGLIYQSALYNCSVIKSINPNHDYIIQNDSAWKDYMAFVICDYCEEDAPLLSFGISVTNEVIYKDLFYLLNACKIERVISENLAQINKVCNIMEVMQTIYIEKEMKECL